MIGMTKRAVFEIQDTGPANETRRNILSLRFGHLPFLRGHRLRKRPEWHKSNAEQRHKYRIGTGPLCDSHPSDLDKILSG